MTALPNIVVVGGSYVGVNTAQQLATHFAGRFRTILLEKNSHFQHLFAYPRFAVASGIDTHKAFIPYIPGTFAQCPKDSGSVLQARVLQLTRSSVQLDRKILLDGEIIDSIPYTYLVIATGTKLTAPSTLPVSEKLEGTRFLQKHAQTVIRSSEIVLIGAGAVGVQMATDIKELYPTKLVTLVHSRPTVMNRFDSGLDRIIKERCRELGVHLKLGSRVKVPIGGYTNDGNRFNVELQDGSRIPADLAIMCTGMTPQSGLLQSIAPNSIQQDGFIRTKRTLQISDEQLPHIFAVGDVANTGAHKAARPGGKQGALVVENIEHLEEGTKLASYEVTDPPAIHMSLGITKNIVFRNPMSDMEDPFVKHRDDGRLDMGIDEVWTRRGGGTNAYL